MTQPPEVTGSDQPLVSVVLPAYNPGEFLKPALESVLQQTLEVDEILVVDDGSPQDVSWVETLSPRIKLLRRVHAGVSLARNAGVLAAQGEYLAFMDQDDIWAPNKLAVQVAALREHPGAALCFCALEVFTGAEPGADHARHPESAPDSHVVLDPGTTTGNRSPLMRSLEFFSRRFVVPSTVMVRRDRALDVGLLDPLLPFSGDFDFLIRLGSRHAVVEIQEVAVYYRRHEGNLSNDYETGRAEVRAMIARYVAYGKSQGDDELVLGAPKALRRPRKLFAAQAFDRARYARRAGDRRSSVKHLARACMLDPMFVARSLARHRVRRTSR